MSEPLIAMARNFTGKLLTGNPATANSAKTVLNMFNNAMYRR